MHLRIVSLDLLPHLETVVLTPVFPYFEGAVVLTVVAVESAVVEADLYSFFRTGVVEAVDGVEDVVALWGACNLRRSPAILVFR